MSIASLVAASFGFANFMRNFADRNYNVQEYSVLLSRFWFSVDPGWVCGLCVCFFHLRSTILSFVVGDRRKPEISSEDLTVVLNSRIR
jgi:hypothetical protein